MSGTTMIGSGDAFRDHRHLCSPPQQVLFAVTRFDSAIQPGTGRTPNTDGIGLETAGVATTGRGFVRVNLVPLPFRTLDVAPTIDAIY